MDFPAAVDTVSDLLRGKGRAELACVPSDATVLEATRIMNEWGIGCVLVTRGDSGGSDSGGALAGIFTERDVLRRVVALGFPPEGTAVADVMTVDVVCCPPEMPVDQLGEIMRSRRIRHVPVVDADERLVGLVSIGDVNAYRFSRCEVALHQVEEYVFRRA